MKILYVTTISNTVNGFLIPHIKMLIEEGHEVHCAFNIVQEVNEELNKMGCKIYDIEFQRSPLSKENIKAYKKLKKLIHQEKYDIVHTHTPVASACVRLACKKLSEVKVIYTVHGFHFFKGAPIKNWLIFYPIEKWLSKYTDCIITINNEDYNIAKEKFNSKYVKMINGVGINTSKFTPQTLSKKIELRKEYGYSEKNFILIFVGELNRNKHQDLLIKTVYKLKDKIPNMKLLLVGNGNMFEKYNKLVCKLGLEEYVEFLGYRSDVPNLMIISDIAVSSSRREGLPVNVMEAMATGLPLIVTNCRGNRDLVKNGKNGYLIEIDDVDSFVNKIEELYVSKNTRENFGKESRKNIEKYELKNVLGEMKNIYSKCLYN
ncbi:glycosyltransferase family 4 protein [Ureibacillus suwonensis]|uniref:Glycosyltransferase family 4 protein n=1 Tax=Ureibacillus suwonensis TaxID=313007 RepID=A0ABW0RDZ5_9BACL